jgi:hypothetical protein
MTRTPCPGGDRPDTRPGSRPAGVRCGGRSVVRSAGWPGRADRDRVHLRPPRRSGRPGRRPGRGRTDRTRGGGGSVLGRAVGQRGRRPSPRGAPIGRWWQCGCGPAWAARAAPPRRPGGGPGRPSGPPGPGPCPGGWPSSSGWVLVGESLAACWRPGWGCCSAAWRLWRLAGGCGSSPARMPRPGGAGRRESGALLGCSPPWRGRGGWSCTTWPFLGAGPTSTTW